MTFFTLSVADKSLIKAVHTYNMVWISQPLFAASHIYDFPDVL